MRHCLQSIPLLGQHQAHVQFYPSVERALGAAGYWLAGLLFGSDLVDHLTTHEVLKLRKSLDEPRRDFVSTHLAKLAEIIEKDPWSEVSMERIKHFVRTELMPAVHRFNQEGKALWERVLGKLSVRFTEMAAGISAGGGAGGLAGSVLPGSSFWTLFLLGAAAGATRIAPKLVSDLIDLAMENRKRKRNGLYYIGNALQQK